MNRGIWIAKKNHICSLIKKISDHYGGDDIEWLRGYAKEVIELSTGEDIERVLNCFLLVDKSLRFVKPSNGMFHIEQRELKKYESRFARVICVAKEGQEV